MEPTVYKTPPEISNITPFGSNAAVSEDHAKTINHPITTYNIVEVNKNFRT